MLNGERRTANGAGLTSSSLLRAARIADLAAGPALAEVVHGCANGCARRAQRHEQRTDPTSTARGQELYASLPMAAISAAYQLARFSLYVGPALPADKTQRTEDLICE